MLEFGSFMQAFEMCLFRRPFAVRTRAPGMTIIGSFVASDPLTFRASS